MWEFIKRGFNWFTRITLALFILGFLLMLYLILFDKGSLTNSELINRVAIITLILSLPATAEYLTQLVNPKKRNFKLTCHCPKCIHLIEMNMREE